MTETDPFVVARSSDGRRVLEAELGDGRVDAWIERARISGVELLWLHSTRDLTEHGFERFPGYVRMRASSPPIDETLALLDPALYSTTLEGAYRGLWGHKLVERVAEPPPEALIVALLDERNEPVGLCTVFPALRLVDGPGVVEHARRAGNYVRLLQGACAHLGRGQVEVDSWGDAPDVIEAYEGLGFAVIERTAGWQLSLA